GQRRWHPRQGGMGARPDVCRLMSSMIGRAIGALVLCLLVGLLLTHLGIAARGILTDTWHTILAVGRLVGDVIQWAVPYTLLGAVVVVPLFADRACLQARGTEIAARRRLTSALPMARSPRDR